MVLFVSAVSLFANLGVVGIGDNCRYREGKEVAFLVLCLTIDVHTRASFHDQQISVV